MVHTRCRAHSCGDKRVALVIESNSYLLSEFCHPRYVHAPTTQRLKKRRRSQA